MTAPTTPIRYVLIPGRHHAVTEFQCQFIRAIKEHAHHVIRDIDGKPLTFVPRPSFVWAVTSANLGNTKRNPVPGHRRLAIVELTGLELGADTFAYPIDDLVETDRFADHVLKSIDVQSDGELALSPYNTAVATSTPSVIAMFEKLGFRILPLELANRDATTFLSPRAWDVTMAVARAGSDWAYDRDYRTYANTATQRIYDKYRLGDLIVRIHEDDILGEEGDLTPSRDYEAYIAAFDEAAGRKYDLIKDFVQPGRIVDIGCAGASLIRAMQSDPRTRESDFYGIEVARRLFELCQRRNADHAFLNENTFFSQRNVVKGKMFPDNSVDTFVTAALTHELYSYASPEALTAFLRWTYEQLTPGGVYLNVDVVGPDNPDQIVLMRLNADDGDPADLALHPMGAESHEDYAAYMATLSTAGRFRHFAREFRAAEREPISFEYVTVGDTEYVRLSLRDAAEFLSKKDYADSWTSEMHEKFCFWSFSEWKAVLEECGFVIDPASKAIRNEWIVKNRWNSKAELFREEDGGVTPMDYPVTNALLVARKP